MSATDTPPVKKQRRVASRALTPRVESLEADLSRMHSEALSFRDDITGANESIVKMIGDLRTEMRNGFTALAKRMDGFYGNNGNGS